MMQQQCRYILIILFFLGIFLRVTEYSVNRSLWLDEAISANKILHTPLSQLTQPFNSSFTTMHAYPMGFLVVEKVLVKILGNSEYVLRLFPFICGILSLFLFWAVAKRVLPGNWPLVAMAFFAISRDLIFYSSELKPFASDIMVILLLYLMFDHIFDRKLSFNKAVMYGMGGGMAVLFSFAAPFVLIGVGGCLLIRTIFRRDKELLIPVLAMTLIWTSFFSAYYFYSLQYFAKDYNLKEFWHVYFMPVDQGVAASIMWLGAVFKNIFNTIMQLPTALASLGFIVGAIAFMREKRKEIFILLAPILLTLLLSAIKLYPFGGRVIVFFIPALILLIVYGIDFLSRNQNLTYARIIKIVLIVCLFFYPLLFSFKQLKEISGPDEIKPVLAYVARHRQEGDAIVLYYGGLESFKYYAPRYGFTEKPLIFRKYHVFYDKQPTNVFADVLTHPRAWIIFSHAGNYKDMNVREAILKGLDRYGQRLDVFEIKIDPHALILSFENNISASAYLYEFSP